MSRPHSHHDHNTVAAIPIQAVAKRRQGNKSPTLITRLGPTPLPSREPEPPRSVTFPWLGLTPQRSTRGATPRQGLEHAAQRQGQPTRLAGASQNHQGQIKAGPQAPSLRDSDNRIPREKNRRGWSEAEASEVLRPPAFEVIDGGESRLYLNTIYLLPMAGVTPPLLTSRPLRPPGRSRLRLSLSP